MTCDSSSILIFTFGLILGVVVGFLIFLLSLKKKIISYVNLFVLISVVLVWVASVLLDMAEPNYQTPISLHGFMGIIVGFYFKPFLSSKEKSDKIES